MTDDVDSELRRLFADDRLDMRPDEDAPARIVAGARRVRRRRAALTVTSSALTIVGLVAAGLALGPLRPVNTSNTAAPVEQSVASSGAPSAPVGSIPLNPAPDTERSDGQPSTSQSAVSSSPTSERPPPSSKPTAGRSSRSLSIPPVTGPVLGPNGYGKLTLGMSFTDAKGTGVLDGDAPAPNGCSRYKLKEGSGGVSFVTISDSSGVVGFEATGAHTPERIRVGSTKDDVEAAYPNLNKSGDGYTADAGAGASYVFGIGDDNRVSDLSLVGTARC